MAAFRGLFASPNRHITNFTVVFLQMPIKIKHQTLLQNCAESRGGGGDGVTAYKEVYMVARKIWCEFPTQTINMGVVF